MDDWSKAIKRNLENDYSVSLSSATVEEGEKEEKPQRLPPRTQFKSRAEQVKGGILVIGDSRLQTKLVTVFIQSKSGIEPLKNEVGNFQYSYNANRPDKPRVIITDFVNQDMKDVHGFFTSPYSQKLGFKRVQTIGALLCIDVSSNSEFDTRELESWIDERDNNRNKVPIVLVGLYYNGMSKNNEKEMRDFAFSKGLAYISVDLNEKLEIENVFQQILEMAVPNPLTESKRTILQRALTIIDEFLNENYKKSVLNLFYEKKIPEYISSMKALLVTSISERDSAKFNQLYNRYMQILLNSSDAKTQKLRKNLKMDFIYYQQKFIQPVKALLLILKRGFKSSGMMQEYLELQKLEADLSDKLNKKEFSWEDMSLLRTQILENYGDKVFKLMDSESMRTDLEKLMKSDLTSPDFEQSLLSIRAQLLEKYPENIPTPPGFGF